MLVQPTIPKHTPAPWHEGIGNGEGSIFGPEGRRRAHYALYPICTITPMFSAYDEDAANARLIARAPVLADLLRVLTDRDASSDAFLAAMAAARDALREIDGATP